MRTLGIEYPSAGTVRLIDIGQPPEPGPNEVLIETVYSGITNGTERHALLGEHGWKGAFPGRHGYQHVGIIARAGELVKGFHVGDWVFYGRYVGHRGWNIQEMSRSDPQANDSHLVIALPPGIDRELCALFGVAGVALRAVRRLRVDATQKVWVVGAGPVGLFAAQAARAFGADVTVTDLIPRRLAVARELGVHIVIDASAPDAPAALREGGPYDRIIDASGAVGLLEDIRRLGVLAHGGAIGLIAVRSDTTFRWSMLHGTEASIEVSCHFGLGDLALLIDLVRRGVIRIAPMISHKEPIQRAPEIYATLRDRPSELLGVIFDWR
jgi:2-desacetyl-2-hydroxyethyl bacteriochlorophyllide A dehydrogenase